MLITSVWSPAGRLSNIKSGKFEFCCQLLSRFIDVGGYIPTVGVPPSIVYVAARVPRVSHSKIP